MSHFKASAYSRPAHAMLRRNTLFSYGYSASEGYPAIREGAADAASGGAVTELRQRLAASDWYKDSETSTENRIAALEQPSVFGTFTANLTKAVKSFQRYSGLTADGIVGPSTWKALGYAGKVTTGSSTRSGGSSGGGKAPVGADVPPPPEESIMDKVWFWPVAILVPTAAVIGGILLWPSKKKAPAAVVAA